MVEFNGDVVFLDASGQVRSTNGDITLRADDSGSGSVIIGSGVSLRPDIDAIIRLGDPNHRWYDAWIGDLHAPSGTIGGPFTSASWTVNGLSVGMPTNFISTDVEFISSTVVTLEAASELRINGWLQVNDVSLFNMDTLMHPTVDNLGTIGETARRFARVHGTSGIFNVLSPQSSGTFIEVDGGLTPGQDSAYSLGTTGQRWLNIFSDAATITTLTASSITGTVDVTSLGTLGVAGLAVFNGGVFFGNDAAPSLDAVSHMGLQGLRWRQMYMVSGQIETIVPRTSGSFTTMHGSFIPGLDCEFSLGFDSNRWGNIHGCSGYYNNLSPQVSGTHIEFHGSLSPSLDATYLLGGAGSQDSGGIPSRWSDVFAASGHFNAIYPQVSGTGVGGNPNVWIEVGGSLIPPTHIGLAGPLWLGAGKFNRWAGIEAGSGVFNDVSATTGDIVTLDTSTLNIASNGDFVNGGPFAWDLGSAEATISNGTWAFSSNVDVEFDKRPTTLASGMAMQAENYFEVYAGRNVSFANPATTMNLYTTSDNTQLTPHDYYLTVNEDVQLRNFSMISTHLNGSQPAPWAVRLRLNDNGFDHASGMMSFHPTGNTSHRSFGSLSGTQTIPAGSRIRVIVDADGGAGHNTIFAKMFLGLTVVSGLQRGPQE